MSGPLPPFDSDSFGQIAVISTLALSAGVIALPFWRGFRASGRKGHLATERTTPLAERDLAKVSEQVKERLRAERFEIVSAEEDEKIRGLRYTVGAEVTLEPTDEGTKVHLVARFEDIVFLDQGESRFIEEIADRLIAKHPDPLSKTPPIPATGLAGLSWWTLCGGLLLINVSLEVLPWLDYSRQMGFLVGIGFAGALWVFFSLFALPPLLMGQEGRRGWLHWIGGVATGGLAVLVVELVLRLQHGLSIADFVERLSK